MTTLTPELLVSAYCQGIFPMAVNDAGEIGWYSPDPRAIIPLDERFHVSKRLQRTVRSGRFEVTVDRDFEAVMLACADADRGPTWISDEIVRAYTRLFELGLAHSVEARLEGRLAGGLYGVHLGGAFFGESMFHTETDASKVALVALVERLRAGGFALLDTQWTTPHLETFGAREIPRAEYLALLSSALHLRCVF
jgi:leucyl/phenylalanyl-tRNA--protein transferase